MPPFLADSLGLRPVDRAFTPSVIGALMLLTSVARSVSGADGPAIVRQSPPLVPYAITLTHGIHLLGQLAPSAAYVIETTEGLVLIDSGLQRESDVLKSQLEKLKLDWRRIRAVLITHAHGDHSGGAEGLRASTGARVYAGHGDAAVLRAGGPREAFFSNFYMPGEVAHRTTVDVELRGGETLTFGDVRFRVLATPGHTPGSTCYLLEKASTRALFTGDVLSMLLGNERSHLEMYKPLGTYSAYLPPRYRGDAKAYLSSLKALRELPVPDLVLPGHPRGDPSPQDPCLSQARWENILDQGIRDMSAIVARHDADGADFLDGGPLRLLPDLYYLGDLQGTAVYGFFASSRFFLVNAPGGDGLVQFVKDRQRALGLAPAAPAVVLLTSCGKSETAGLRALVESCHAEVVAAPAVVQQVRGLCPAGTTLISADELPSRGWVDVTPVSLRMGPTAPIAYEIRWAGKKVLFSGPLPIRLKDEPEYERLQLKDEAKSTLFIALSKSRAAALDFLTSVNRLGALKPDLWLPTTPVDGQNANIYDDEWKHMINANYRIGYFYLAPKG